MLQSLKFSLWCDGLKFSEKERKIIEEIRSSEPVRHRQSRVGNSTGLYASDKTGRTHQFESRTDEFIAIVSMEHDEEVLEYYDQPSKIEMRYTAKSGRPVVFWHTPDFFVLRINGAGWEEWKPEEKLVELAESMPNRYQRDEQGDWRCPPGEEYAKRYGLTYKVCSSAKLNPIYVRNLNFLEDYLRDPHLQVDPAALKIMHNLFTEEPVMTLNALLEHIEAQHIYSALLLKHFYVDLYAAPLADSEYVHIFRNKEVADAYIILTESPYKSFDSDDADTVIVGIGQRVVWDGRVWTIFNHGDTVISMRSEQGGWAEIRKDEFHSLASQGVITQPVQKSEIKLGDVSDEEEKILAKAKKQGN